MQFRNIPMLLISSDLFKISKLFTLNLDELFYQLILFNLNCVK